MKIIISGGGTAGHIYPALAVAKELKSRGHEILFVGAQGKMEMERVPKAGFEIVGLPVVGLQRRLTLKNLALPFKLFKSLRVVRGVIRDFAPDVVVGFGGYASAPVLWSAARGGIPTVIQEQNSYAGLANKILSKRARAICVAYDGMERFFPASKITLTGNPLLVKPSAEVDKAGARERMGLRPEGKVVLIVGGSLGTRTMNEAVMSQLEKGGFGVEGGFSEDVQVIWQCGRFYYDEFCKRSQGYNIEPRAFIESMSDAYGAADLVVTRAGASTISELQLLGKAAVFVPSPNVSEDHQTKNAMAMVSVGAGEIVKDNELSEQLFSVVSELLSKPERMEAMAMKIKSFARENSASDVADIALSFAHKQSKI